MKLINSNPAVHLLKEFCLFYNERDLEGALNLFLKTQEPFLWGTGVDERHRGLEAIRGQLLRDWGQSENGRIEFNSSSFIHSDDPHWASGEFAAIITINGQTYTYPHLRGSIYTVKEGHDWKISHMHASFPESTQQIGQSFPQRV